MINDALTGEYTLLVGMYIGDERLAVHRTNGQIAGNQVELTKIQVIQ